MPRCTPQPIHRNLMARRESMCLSEVTPPPPTTTQRRCSTSAKQIQRRRLDARSLSSIYRAFRQTPPSTVQPSRCGRQPTYLTTLELFEYIARYGIGSRARRRGTFFQRATTGERRAGSMRQIPNRQILAHARSQPVKLMAKSNGHSPPAPSKKWLLAHSLTTASSSRPILKTTTCISSPRRIMRPLAIGPSW